MSKPLKKDLRTLKELRNDVAEIMTTYESLNDKTQDFLREEFNTETWIHLRNFDDNLRDTIEEMEKIK